MEPVMSNSLKFGTSGLRGLAGDLDRATCHSYVAAFLDLLASRNMTPSAIVIGRDLRQSSTRIAGWCGEMAMARGIIVINGGEVPTPAVARYALSRELPALMVTASHNPAQYNGIKFYRPDGELMKEDEAPMRALLGPQIPAPQYRDLPEVEGAVAGEYVLGFTELFLPNALEGVRLAVDQHSAVGRDLLVEIFEALGAECVVLRRSETFIPVDTEALDVEFLEMAREWLAADGFDALISTDGDGDRPLLLDASGEQILGDTMGVLTARYFGYEHIVTPVSSTSAVEASGWFERAVRTRIGSPFVIAAMRDTISAGRWAVAGFEANGGFLTGGRQAWRGHMIPPLMTRDAIMPLVAVLAMAKESGISVHGLTQKLPPRAKAAGRLPDIDTSKAQGWIERLVARPSLRETVLPMLAATTDVETLDGAKFILADGSSIHFRLSGNAPELRCYVESDDRVRSAMLLKRALDAARMAVGGAVLEQAPHLRIVAAA
jgi:phosphomannomutase